MIGFLVNDLHDIERDRENHPERALPQGVPPPAVASFFFALLVICLFMIRLSMAPETAFIYLVGLLSIINYNYVVAYLWPLKNVYAAAVTILPLFVIWPLVSPTQALVMVAPALFLHVMGTEMLSDVQDHKGDGPTPAKALGLHIAAQVAFGSKLCGETILLLSATQAPTIAAALLILVIEALYIGLWRSGADRGLLTRLTFVQVALGLPFLL